MSKNSLTERDRHLTQICIKIIDRIFVKNIKIGTYNTHLLGHKLHLLIPLSNVLVLHILYHQW